MRYKQDRADVDKHVKKGLLTHYEGKLLKKSYFTIMVREFELVIMMLLIIPWSFLSGDVDNGVLRLMTSFTGGLFIFAIVDELISSRLLYLNALIEREIDKRTKN